MRKFARVTIWISIIASFARGLESFDGGASANNLETVAAASALGAALIAAAIMFCFDRPAK